jgi:uncharacterized coiled-coil protein SlyX
MQSKKEISDQAERKDMEVELDFDDTFIQDYRNQKKDLLDCKDGQYHIDTRVFEEPLIGEQDMSADIGGYVEMLRGRTPDQITCYKPSQWIYKYPDTVALEQRVADLEQQLAKATDIIEKAVKANETLLNEKNSKIDALQNKLDLLFNAIETAVNEYTSSPTSFVSSNLSNFIRKIADGLSKEEQAIKNGYTPDSWLEEFKTNSYDDPSDKQIINDDKGLSQDTGFTWSMAFPKECEMGQITQPNENQKVVGSSHGCLQWESEKVIPIINGSCGQTPFNASGIGIGKGLETQQKSITLPKAEVCKTCQLGFTEQAPRAEP